MKYAEITGLAEKEIVKRTKELRGEIFEARMKNALGQLANPMTIRWARRDVARLQTALNAHKATQTAGTAGKSKKTSVRTRGKTKSAAKG